MAFYSSPDVQSGADQGFFSSFLGGVIGGEGQGEAGGRGIAWYMYLQNPWSMPRTYCNLRI